MADLDAVLSKPEEWVEEYAKISAEEKKLGDRKKHLADKIKLRMKELGLQTLPGISHEAVWRESERTVFTQEALGEIYGTAWLDDTIKKLPKAKSEYFRVAARKELDPKAKEIVDHFAGGAQAPAASAPPTGRKPFPR